MNVVKKAKRNIVSGVFYRIILMLCPFVERTLVRYTLGADYLGLSSLFTSVLSVLSLSELGLSSAIVYNLYKPIAENDTKTVNAILRLYRGAYRIIGLVIAGIGICMIPFLPHLIKGEHPADINLTLLYLIYLANAVISYFLFGYRSVLLVANQRNDIETSRNAVVKILLMLCQAVVLLLAKNYYYMILLLPVFTALGNLWIGYAVHKAFPQYRCEGNVSKRLLAEIKHLVAGTFVQKSCALTRNSLDSICISAFLGLTTTTVYGNYYMILYGVQITLTMVCSAFAGGVGQNIVKKSKEENFRDMENLDFVYLWLGGMALPCFLCLYQPFMTLWMGEDMLLPMPAVVLLCVYFYMLLLGDVRTVYCVAIGIWWEMRYRAIAETILNLVLNIVLGKFFGVYGIISATILSLFFCNYIWGSFTQFRLYFSKKRIGRYFAYQFRQSLVNVLVCAVCCTICYFIHFGSLALTMLVRLVVCVLLTNLLFVCIYHKSEKFLYLCDRVLRRNSNVKIQ